MKMFFLFAVFTSCLSFASEDCISFFSPLDLTASQGTKKKKSYFYKLETFPLLNIVPHEILDIRRVRDDYRVYYELLHRARDGYHITKVDGAFNFMSTRSLELSKAMYRNVKTLSMEERLLKAGLTKSNDRSKYFELTSYHNGAVFEFLFDVSGNTIHQILKRSHRD